MWYCPMRNAGMINKLPNRNINARIVRAARPAGRMNRRHHASEAFSASHIDSRLNTSIIPRERMIMESISPCMKRLKTGLTCACVSQCMMAAAPQSVPNRVMPSVMRATRRASRSNGCDTAGNAYAKRTIARSPHKKHVTDNTRRLRRYHRARPLYTPHKPQINGTKLR